MGHGIAQVAAKAGLRVVMRDVEESLAAAALARIRGNLDKGIARGKVTEEQREQVMSRLSSTAVLEDAVEGVDAVIEAAPETMAIKLELFRAVDRAAPAHALLASNTSSLSIGRIASIVDEPARVVGMHFFNPVHIMKLVEIIHHEGNPPEVVAEARAFGERLGKTAVVIRDVPGFASSRLGIAIGLEAIRMVEQQVGSAEDIDTAMKLGYGFPMGPLELTDLVGLDVRLSIAEYLASELGPRFDPPALLRSMVAEGKLGKKAGRGFYDWSAR